MAKIQSKETTENFLSFRLSADLQGILPASKLTEILTLTIDQIVPIPGVAPETIGVFNWRGNVLWLIDLGYLLKEEPLYSRSKYQSQYNVMILHHEDCALGLVVEQVKQIVRCNPNEFQPFQSAQALKVNSPCIRGYWLSPQEETVLVLDSAALFQLFRS
jgi:positive phototaxis protein PixI